MDWTAAAPLLALPLTAVSALWPVIRDGSSIARLERVARIAEMTSLSAIERRRLEFLRHRLGRRVFARTAVRRRWGELIGGLYLVIAGPLLLIAEMWLLATGNAAEWQEAVQNMAGGLFGLLFGIAALKVRKWRMRKDLRRVIRAQRPSFVDSGLGRGAAGGSRRESRRERVKNRVRRLDA